MQDDKRKTNTKSNAPGADGPQQKESKASNAQEEFTIAGGKLIEKIKQLINEGNVRRIIIKNEAGQVMVEIPLTIAAVGTFLAPVLAAVGAMAALLTNCTIVVQRKK